MKPNEVTINEAVSPAMKANETRANEPDEKIRKTMMALERNNIIPYYAESAAKAAEIAMSLVAEGSTISCGGSVTLVESGILAKMRSSKYKFLDRAIKGLTAEEVEELQRKTFFADAFFTSSNAVTENGELYNVDGNANRIAAIAYGPKKVIVVVGENKIVENLEEAQHRVKCVAAPLNATRLHTETPCERFGKCIAAEGTMAEGCRSERRMCCQYLTTAYQRQKGRIIVIITPTSLGY
ncbi:MAG: lactate utilization protein [Oscillospiraceae bacterium]